MKKEKKKTDDELNEIEKPFTDILIISQQNKFLVFWNVITIVSSLISSYFYIYMAAFVSPIPGDNLYDLDLFFEFIFAISMILEFFKEY